MILDKGGYRNLLQYYNGGRVSRDPKFVLRNIWTAPSWEKHIAHEIFVISEFLKRQLKMGAGSKEVATIEALPDKVNGTTPTKNQPALFTFGRVFADEFWDIKGTVENT